MSDEPYLEEESMTKIVVLGVSSRTGTIHKLEPMKGRGQFQLTAPNLTSDERKREANYTWVDTIEEAAELIEEHGYYARMTNIETDGAPDIIANEFIKVFRLP
ncbi:hypothetical protein F0U60_29395 [Archangium minus]|uniref:Uncharacterized protein n=1 Tax=Archangium minus TaxID=83450 RepID=A0ABY9WXC0_9BACT|nr:hypothetical protein F0U60_29395 [Archangium minus]